MRESSRWWAGMAALWLVASAAAQAPQEPARKGDFFNGKDFRLTAVVAKDTDGNPITDIPAFRLGYRDTDGDWQEVSQITPVVTIVPTAMRQRVMLVFDGGWLLVPRGWKVSDALLTPDTTLSIGFEAPGGPREGWMRDGMVVSSGTAQDEAAPYFARPMRDLRDLREEYGDVDWARPRAPYRPLHLRRPDGCTVIFDYHMHHSPPVHAWINYVGVQYGVLDSFDIAMPSVDRDLRNLIFADHTQDPETCVVRQDRA